MVRWEHPVAAAIEEARLERQLRERLVLIAAIYEILRTPHARRGRVWRRWR